MCVQAELRLHSNVKIQVRKILGHSLDYVVVILVVHEKKELVDNIHSGISFLLDEGYEDLDHWRTMGFSKRFSSLVVRWVIGSFLSRNEDSQKRQGFAETSGVRNEHIRTKFRLKIIRRCLEACCGGMEVTISAVRQEDWMNFVSRYPNGKRRRLRGNTSRWFVAGRRHKSRSSD